jgi:hypothetical protein
MSRVGLEAGSVLRGLTWGEDWTWLDDDTEHTRITCLCMTASADNGEGVTAGDDESEEPWSPPL